MARLSTLVTVVAAALLVVTAIAAPAPAESFPALCKPEVCMGLAVFHSDCFNGTDSIPVTPEGGAAIPVQLAQCVCADPDSKKNYLNCYGFCDIDEATEPYCSQPVKTVDSDDENDKVNTNEVKKCDPFSKVCHDPDRERQCIGPGCANWDPRLSGTLGGFCVVPGQACYGAKAIDSSEVADTAEPDATAPEHPEITAPVELHKRDELVEHQLWRNSETLTHPSIGKFCPVRGQACYDMAIAAPTTAPGSAFVDVGDVQSDELEGEIGGGAKRAVGVVNGPVPTTLQIAKDYLRPSN